MSQVRSSAKAASALRRHSLDHPAPTFVPIDNWDKTAHRPEANAAVLQQPITQKDLNQLPERVKSGAQTLCMGCVCLIEQDLFDALVGVHLRS